MSPMGYNIIKDKGNTKTKREVIKMTITVFYTDGTNEFETGVDYNTVEEATAAVKNELEPFGYTVLEEKTREQFELDHMFDDIED